MVVDACVIGERVPTVMSLGLRSAWGQHLVRADHPVAGKVDDHLNQITLNVLIIVRSPDTRYYLPLLVESIFGLPIGGDRTRMHLGRAGLNEHRGGTIDFEGEIRLLVVVIQAGY